MLYKGNEVEHAREPLASGSQIQLMLFYVAQDSKWADACKFDARPSLGAPASTKCPEKKAQIHRLLKEHSSAD